ncbi:MAG: ribose transport system substrate-binding protein [Aliidongia sp.]|jgi:ribose transport system substrate-binding protein|nr:ribose transport system substrate-binding protein [Aliidongia sp.]
MKRVMVAAGLAAGLVFWAPAGAQTKPTVPVIVSDAPAAYWQAVLAGARKAGLDLGANVVELTGKADLDAGGQAGLLDKAMAANPAAIVIAPAQFTAMGKSIDEAAKKVKIVAIGSAPETKSIVSVVATDNVKAGQMAADALALAIKKSYAESEGDVALITARPGVAALDQRAQGFKATIAEKYRALDISADKVADGKPATAVDIMNDLIAHSVDLRGVFASDTVMAEAVGQAISAKKNGDKINVIGVGADDALVDLLKRDVIAGLVLEDPFRIGYESVKTALAAAKGEQVAASIDTGATLVTKANIASARSQELLNPKVN